MSDADMGRVERAMFVKAIDPMRVRAGPIRCETWAACNTLLPSRHRAATASLQDRPRRPTGTKQQEEVMGKAVPEQHSAVVLRSHYNHLRALLVAALIAVLGLAGAVVIVANDDDPVVSPSTPAIEPGATGVPDTAPAPRYDGGPNEGSADIVPGVNIPARPNQAQAFPGHSQQAQQAEAGVSRHDIRIDLRRLRAGGATNQGSADVTMSPPVGHSAALSQSRYDGGPNEGSADVTTAKPGAVPETGSPRYDGGPNEGSADVTTGDGGGKASVMPQSDGFRFGHPSGN